MQYDVEMHDTAESPTDCEPTGADHEVPSNTTASPWESTATQNSSRGQETAVKLSSPATAGDDQFDPFHVEHSPWYVAASQNVADAHETPVGCRSKPSRSGRVHELASNVSTAPSSSTTAQNEAVGHDTASGIPTVGSNRIGSPQPPSDPRISGRPAAG